jgi:hypothetical protein
MIEIDRPTWFQGRRRLNCYYYVDLLQRYRLYDADERRAIIKPPGA